MSAPLNPSTTLLDQSGGGASSVQTDGANGVFIAPFIAELNADASGTVGVLQQTTVLITGVDKVIDVTVNETHAKNILKLFEVVDMDSSANKWADVSVNVVGSEQNFKDALAAAIDDVSSGSTSTVFKGVTRYGMYGYLYAESYQDTLDQLSYDTLANLLEASDLMTFGIDIDAIGGAKNMYDAINAGSPLNRKALFTQIDEARVEQYLIASDGSGASREGITKLAFLPLLKGDKLVFVFDTKVGDATAAYSSGARMTREVNDNSSAANISGSGITGTAEGTNYSNDTITFTKPSTRRVALQIALTNGSGAFGVNTSLSTGAMTLA